MTDPIQQPEENAPGTGAVLSAAPKAALDAKLQATVSLQAGTEELSQPVALRVSELLTSPASTPQTKQLLMSTLGFMRETSATSNLDGKDGARKHVALYRDVQNYLNNPPGDFRKGFAAFLRIVADQKKNGVFSPRFLFRFVQHMTLNNNDRRGLELLFQCLVDLSVAEGRARVLKQVDLSKIGQTALMPSGAQSLVSFFTL